MSLPWGAPREGGAPRAISRYLCGYDDPCGGWVLLGGQPVLLQPGRLLSVYEAERGIPGDGSVALVCPGADPLGLRRLRAADVDYVESVDDIDNSDIKNNAAVTLPLAPVSVRGHQGALPGSGADRWPSLPLAVTAISATTAAPTTAGRRQRRAAAALRRNTAKVAAALAASVAALAAGTLGSHQGASDTPGAGGGASPSALAPRTLPGAGSWADLMDADDAAAEKASGGFSPPVSGALGAPGAGGGASPSAWSAPRIVHGSQRAAGGADGGALGSPGAGGDASPSARSTLRTAPGSHRAAGGAAGGALGASGAGGAASPSAQSAPRTVPGSHQAAGGAACGALGAASPSNLTPCSGPSFPPAPRLGAIHKSKCGLPPDPPLTLQVTPSSGASAGGARFKGSGGNSEAAPVPPWSGTGGSTSSDVQTTRSGGSDSTSSDVQATRSSGSGNTGNEVPTARFGGSGNTGRDVQTTRTGGSGSTNSDVQTTRSDS